MPKIVDHDARRREILEGCFALFAAQGYAALSMRGIARALGVSTGALYYYFDSKEAIFEEMVRLTASRDVAVASAETPEDAPRAERLAGLMRFLQRSATPLLQTIQVSLEYRRQHARAEDDLLQSTLGLYRRALVDQLHMSEPDAAVTLSFLMGALVQLHLDPDAVDLGDHLAALEQLLTPR